MKLYLQIIQDSDNTYPTAELILQESKSREGNIILNISDNDRKIFVDKEELLQAVKVLAE